MSNPEFHDPPSRYTNARFTRTHWSVVLRAREADTQCAHDALEKLSRTYWPPLYAFIRRQGYNVEDAKDLTQEFLTRLIHRDWLGHLQHQQGKFRSFLLTFLKHFLSDQRDRARAQKRGSGRELVSLDACETEERDHLAPSIELTPDEIFERRWAEAVMKKAMEQLRADYATRGQAALFDVLKDLQPGEHGERSHAQVGAELGMTGQAIKNAALRFRRRYAQLLREEIAETVLEPAEAEEELQHLLRIFSR